MKTHTLTVLAYMRCLVNALFSRQILCKDMQGLLLSFCLFLFAQQALAINYVFSDAGIVPALAGCSRTGAGTYACTNAVTLTGNDSITILGTTPATINFSSNLTLQFINEATQAKINLAGAANNLNVVVGGTLSMGKKTVINANVRAGAVNDFGGDVLFGGSLATTTGTINIGYNSTVLGPITSTTGNINLNASDQDVQSITCNCNITGGYGVIYNGNVSGVTVTSTANDAQYRGSITATTGGISLAQNTTVAGAVSSTSGNITIGGNNTLSSTVSCTTCSLFLQNNTNRLNDNVIVGLFYDYSTGSQFAKSIIASRGFFLLGTSSVVNGDVNVNASTGYTSYFYPNSRVNGNFSMTSTGAGVPSWVYMYNGSLITGTVEIASNYWSHLEMYSSSTVNGRVRVLNTNPANSGNVANLYVYTGSRINNSAYVNGNIYNYGTITGCAQNIKSPASTGISLYGGSTTGGICCGTSFCSASCVANFTGRALPSTCTLSTTPLLSYLMEQTTWNGTTGEVLDSSGNNYHATAARRSGTAFPTTDLASPAIPTTPGTCRYATFNGSQYLSVPSNFPNINGTFTISAWIRSTDVSVAGQRIFIDDENNVGGFGFSLGDPGPGRLRFFKRGTIFNAGTGVDSPSVIANNQWYFVAVVVDAATSRATLYIYNQSGTLLDNSSAPFSNIGEVDNGRASAGSETVSSAENLGFRGNIDELNIYTYAMTPAQIDTQRQAMRACPGFNLAAADFNCVAPNANPNTGRLNTQVAGNAFSVDVVALKSGGAGIETNYVTSGTKSVTVEFVDSSAGSCSTFPVLNPTSSQTVTFSGTDATIGRKNMTATIDNAYRNLRCRVTDTNQSPALVRCSSDNFAVRPSAFTSIDVTGVNADISGTSETATPALKAGDGTFTLQANTGLTNYNGTPKLNNSMLGAHAGAVRTGAVTGNFSAAANGSATGTTFKYSEVGYFRLNQNAVYDDDFTAVDSPSDCAAGLTASGGLNACSFGNSVATGFLGRFIPDHFIVAKNVAVSPNPSQTCGSFSYFGQPGLSTAFTVAAQNFDNQVTQNYTGRFARLNLTDWTALGFSATNKPASVTLSGTSDGTWSNGNATVTAQHLLSRPASPVVPTTITMTARPIDADAVTASSATAVADASDFRFGRLNFSNAHGSELLPLSFVVEAQYWATVGAYQRNTLDNCSAVNRQAFVMGGYTKNLNACETQLSGGATMVNGKTALTLSRPGAGNNGSVTISANLDNGTGAGIQTCTSGAASSATGLNLPQFGTTDVTRRATFGVYKSPLIYMREAF